MSNNSCAIITEPPLCFPWGYDEEDETCAALKLLLLHKISWLNVQDVSQFHIPLNDGLGLCAAEIVHSLRQTSGPMRLICYQPWEEQATKWHPDLRDRYFNILSACDDSVLSAYEQTSTCELDAMLDAIDRAKIVLVVSAGEQPKDKTFAAALRYAGRTGRDMQTITPFKLY